MTTGTIQTLNLQTVRADDESFAPYGSLIKRPSDATANLAAGTVESWRLPFEAGSPPQIMFNRYHNLGREFSIVERHLEVTQCYFPLGNTPYIMVVGLEPSDQSALTPQDLRAFYIEGNQGVLLWKNVWHALTRFPVNADYIDMTFITDDHTQKEMESYYSKGTQTRLSDFVDFKKSHQLQFLVKDL